MAWADGGGHPALLPREREWPGAGARLPGGWMPGAAELTVMSAMHSLI